jgi:hypothetical protein
LIVMLVLSLGACGAEKDKPAAGQKPFPSYGYKPPAAEYDGELFKLSQDYPAEAPKGELPPFFKTDFKKDWRTYMLQVRDYCFDGNVGVDWRVEKNKVRRWYHMPWQHYGPAGREGIHGLTQEAPVRPNQLAATQSFGDGSAYAVGFYNDRGAYAIGQVWKDHEKPDPKPAGDPGFPNGTVVCKNLFLDMPPEIAAAQVPSLANPVEWQAYTVDANSKPPTRSVKEVSLIQMDIMIRDVRAPYGWIFGTFQYNGQLKKAEPWENLVPVGLMWGNDPDLAENLDNVPEPDEDGGYPPLGPWKSTPINNALQETVINPDSSELPPTHLGWEGRLNGPVDNPRSSCMSCHMTASYPAEPLSPLFTSTTDPPGSDAFKDWWMQWFQDVGWQDGKLEKFLDASQALDFSLQLSAALHNFHLAHGGDAPENEVRR